MHFTANLTRRLLGLLFLLGCGIAAAATPTSGSAGPLRWQSTMLPPVLTRDAALAAATRLLQPASGDSLDARLVQVTDSYAAPGYSAPTTVYTAWLISGVHYPLTNSNIKASDQVELSALMTDSPTGVQQLYAVFSARNTGQWVYPYSGFKPRSPAASTVSDQWQADLSPAVLQPTLPIGTLLSGFWQTTGIDPARTGQFALIGRHAAPLLPATRSNGKLLPLYPAATYWVMQIDGTLTRRIIVPAVTANAKGKSGPPPYMSGMVSLIEYRTGRVLRSVYYP